MSPDYPNHPACMTASWEPICLSTPAYTSLCWISLCYPKALCSSPRASSREAKPGLVPCKKSALETFSQHWVSWARREHSSLWSFTQVESLWLWDSPLRLQTPQVPHKWLVTGSFFPLCYRHSLRGSHLSKSPAGSGVSLEPQWSPETQYPFHPSSTCPHLPSPTSPAIWHVSKHTANQMT